MLPLYFSSGRWLSFLFPSLIWEIKEHHSHVFLTFDDGPHPDHTLWVLDQLDLYGFKATFFCIGNNVAKYPHVYQEIIDRGHAVGNHTFHHINGYKSSSLDYFDEVNQCAQLVESRLFRPPYGRITRSQIRGLLKDYQIIMWSILSGDYDKNLNRELSLQVMKRKIRSGSIVVFHDSEKASQNLKVLLPELLEFMQQNGLKSASL